MDSWNPHATWPSLQLYLAMCAKFGIFPSQADYVMAYLQVNMKERVFVQLPHYWTAHMPDDLKSYCGVPLLLMKALYGYTFSENFLYEEQEDFLISFGMQSTPMPALWCMHLPGGGVLMVLQYSDDFLIASTDAIIKNKFKTDLSTFLRLSGSHMLIGFSKPAFDRTPTATSHWTNIATAIRSWPIPTNCFAYAFTN